MDKNVSTSDSAMLNIFANLDQITIWLSKNWQPETSHHFSKSKHRAEPAAPLVSGKTLFI